MNVGDLFGSLSWHHDKKGADDFDQRYDQAQAKAKKKIEAQLGAAVDEKAFAKYHESLDRAERRAKEKAAFQVALGADYDPKGFNAYQRAIQQAEREAKRASSSGGGFHELNKAMGDLNRQASFARNSVSLIKWPALITGAGLAAQAMSAAGGAAVALGSALAPLSGALAAYPALGSAAAQGIGVFKLGTAGLADGLKAAAQGGKAWEDELKKLTPMQAQFVRELKPVVDNVKGLKAEARENMLPGLERGALAAARNVGVLRPIVAGTAKEIGHLADEAGRMVGSRAWGRDFETQGRRNETTIRRAGEGGLHLANALRNVTLAAGPLVEWMTRMGLRFTEVIDKQAQAGRESGKLAGFFEQTRVAMSRVARIGADLATAFFNIGRAGKPLGDEILVSLVKNAEAFKDWTDSARGQNAIRKWFDDAKPAIFELGRLLRDAVQVFGRLGQGNQVSPLIRKIRVELLPVIESVIDQTTKAFGPPLVDAITEVLKLLGHMAGTSGPLTQTVVLVGRIAGAMNRLLDKFPALNSAVVTLAGIGGIAKALGITSAIGGVTRLIGQLKLARSIAAATTALEAGGAAAGAGRAAAGGAAAAGAGAGAAGAATRGGVAGAVVSKLPIAAIGVAIAAAIAAAIPKTKAHRKLTDFFDFDSTKLDDQLSAVDRFNKALGRLSATGDKRGADKLADQFDRLKKTAHGLGSVKEIDKITDAANDLAKAGGTLQRDLNRSLDRAAAHFADFRKTGSNNLKGIRTATADNMHFIKRTLGEDSAAGKEALARNFRLARTAIRQAMADGKISVKDGLAEIQRLMRAELKQYGITGKTASAIIKHGNIGGAEPEKGVQGAQRGGRIRRAIGGWIGARGMVSDDIVPIGDNALAAYGEYLAVDSRGRKAVLNRHQAPIADMALAAGGYRTLDQGADLSTIERALLPLGGLDRLFAAITRPHYLAGGGIVPVPGFPGESAASSVIPMILQIARRFGLTLTDAYGQGHKSPGHTIYGTAADFAGPDRSMDAAVRSLVSAGYLVGYDGRYGSQDWPGHGPAAGQGGANAHLHVELGGKGGAIGGAVTAAVRKITAPRTGSTGALGAIAQGALNAVTAGANQRLERAAAASLAVPVGGGGTGGGGGGGANRALGRSMAAAMGWTGAQWSALERLWTGESNWNENAMNPSSGAGGIPQALPASKMGPGWQGNPRQQIAWGLNYIRERYGSPSAAFSAWSSRSPHWYSLGGIVQRFAPGGRVGKRKPRTVAPRGKVTHEGQPTTLNIRGLRKTTTGQIGEYEDIQGEIEDLRKRYELQDREYNLTDEELVDPDTGAVNVDAVLARADELVQLRVVRERIYALLVRAKLVADRVVKSTRTLIKRLQTSLIYAKAKNRSGIKGQIRDLREQLTEYTSHSKDLGFDITDAQLDVQDLIGERASVLGTQPQDQGGGGDADAGTDVGAGDAGDVAAEPAARPPTALEIAQGVAAEFATFRSAQSDLLRSFGANATTRQQAFGGGGPFSGHPDDLALAAGVRAFGGAADLSGTLGAGRGGPYVAQMNVIYQQPISDPATHVQQLRNIVENGVGG